LFRGNKLAVFIKLGAGGGGGSVDKADSPHFEEKNIWLLPRVPSA